MSLQFFPKSGVTPQSVILNEEGHWDQGPELPTGYEVHGSALGPRTIGDKSDFLLAGGRTHLDNTGVLVANVLVYSFKTQSWTYLPSLPEPRAYGTISPYTKDSGNQIIIFAGTTALSYTLKYNSKIIDIILNVETFFQEADGPFLVMPVVVTGWTQIT